MDTIRLGTIGTGFIVHEILNAAEQTEGISLAAVYSRSYEKGKNLADQYGACRVYTELDAFLADETVNVVYIASPNSVHYEQTKRALLAGKHVLCEKPFCEKVEQALELEAIAKEKRLFLLEAVPTTFLPNYQVLKQLLPRIGRIRLVMANYSQYSSRYDKLLRGEVTNVFDPAFGGGCLMDINYYNIYLNAALFHIPEQAVYYPNLFPDPKIDTSGVAVLRYADFISENAAAKDTWGENYFQIEGEKGHIYVTGGSNGLLSVRIATADGEEECNLQTHTNRWLYEVQEVTKLLLSENYEAASERFRITLRTVRILEKLRRSMQI